MPPPPPTPDAALARLSRRRLGLGGLGGAVLLALGGAGVALQPSRRPAPPREPLRVLTLDEHAIVTAIGESSCPRPGPDVPGAAALDLGSIADRFLARADRAQVDDVKLVLALFESGLVGAVFFERVRPFTQLAPPDRDRVLEAWRDSAIPLRRTIARALMGLTTALYYADARTWPGIGYPGPPDPSALRRAYADQLVDLEALRATPGART